jgi:nucleoside-diphosphate-sugar epimerase
MDQALLARDLELVLKGAAPSWPTLKNAHLFMTGGTGFFGRWIVETLLHANRELDLDIRITLLTRSADAFAKRSPHLAHHPSVELLIGDVTDFEDPTHRFTHLIHAATPADAKLARERPLELYRTITLGTQRILELAAAHGTRRFLNVSSGAVYGKEAAHVDEASQNASDSMDPNQTYGIAKRTAEHLCQLAAARSQLEVVTARCFAFIGPHLPTDAHYAAGNFLGAALRGEPIQVQGDGSAVRSYMHTTELVVWLLRLLTHGKNMNAYNVGSEETVSISQLAQSIARLGGVDHSVLGLPRPGMAPSIYVPSTKKAQNELELTESLGLEEKNSRTLEWMKKVHG